MIERLGDKYAETLYLNSNLDPIYVCRDRNYIRVGYVSLRTGAIVKSFLGPTPTIFEDP